MDLVNKRDNSQEGYDPDNINEDVISTFANERKEAEPKSMSKKGEAMYREDQLVKLTESVRSPSTYCHTY